MRKASLGAAAFAAVFVCATALAAGPWFAKAAAAPSASPAATVTCAQANAPTAGAVPVPTVIDASCAVIPHDFNGTPGQTNTDIYAWLTFIAVNWPANPRACAPDPKTSILSGPQSPTWLTYLTNDDVFVPAPRTPDGWCHLLTGRLGAFASTAQALNARRTDEIAHLPLKVRALAQTYVRTHADVPLFLHHNAKGQDLVSTIVLTHAPVDERLKGILDATKQPVVDQNGRFLRFTVSMGKDEYDYITGKTTHNKLWTKAGQAAAKDLNFPVNSADSLGSMEFKAAWKVLGANDDPRRFFTMPAIVYNDVDEAPSPGKNPVTVGLVGLHIIHKTAKQRRWLWSTFEQVDNDTKSFFNPKCPAAQCPPNVETAPTPYVELDKNGKPLNKPVQVVPAENLDTVVGPVNDSFRKLLAGTPWAYYKQISTQWVGEFGVTAKPVKLGNSVLETFVDQNSSIYSCMQCHSFAHDKPGGFKSDFSFMIDAKQ